MKSYRKILTVTTNKREEYINLTREVQTAIDESGIAEGLCLVNPMHITASVFINDDEGGLHHDFEQWLNKYVPYSPDAYRHNLTGEDNAFSHIKRQLMGREVVVAVTGGRLDLGTWERIFYGEYDGQRAKRILIKIIGE